jgi:hypothetical protein
MNIRSALLTSCMGLLWAVSGHATAAAPRDALLLEFVQDMAWLEDSGTRLPAATDDQRSRIESIDSFFSGAQARLNELAPFRFSSLEPVAEAFATHRQLVNQLGGEPLSDESNRGVDLASLAANNPGVRVRLENLSQNYLHLAQLVMYDERGDAEGRINISAETKQRILAFVARYPVDKEDANGYLSALWFIRENLKKWKCEDEV